jgi:hypothetical protein
MNHSRPRTLHDIAIGIRATRTRGGNMDPAMSAKFPKDEPEILTG